MSEIRLQYSTASSFGAWAIRYWSAGLWSHVDTVLSDGRLLGARSDVLKGVPAGVQIRPSNYEDFTGTAVVSLPCSPEALKAYSDFETLQLGKPYDEIGIGGFIIPSLVKRQDDWRDPSAWFCSELKQAALEASGLMPKIDFPDNKVTPVASYCMVQIAGGKIIREWSAL